MLFRSLTNAIFQNDFGSTQGIWGAVSEGDRVPYIPRHQLNLSLGFAHKNYELNFSSRYNGAFNTRGTSGGTQDPLALNDNIVVDFSAKYHLTSQISLTANVINLFDEVYAAARVPAGFRPGHPFGAYAGLQFRL